MHANIRIKDIALHIKAKIRAAKEGKSIQEMTESLWREYLKKPINRE